MPTPDDIASSTIAANRPRSTRPNPRRRLTRSDAHARTRQRLLDSAAKVFADKGFQATTLTDVADRAGYTIGAVYSNFASKDALFHALMRERLAAVEGSIAAGLPAATSVDARPRPSAEIVEGELDRMAAAEDAVPPGWWRLLAEFRAYAATNPDARAELVESERRCRDLIAAHVERFATSAGIRLPMPAIDLVDLTTALTDGLRAAHAEGRTALTPGEGLRRVVSALLATAPSARDSR